MLKRNEINNLEIKKSSLVDDNIRGTAKNVKLI